MNYEIDTVTGYPRLDRPQRGSAQPPTLYGFISRTYCAARVAALSPEGVNLPTAIASTSASSPNGLPRVPSWLAHEVLPRPRIQPDILV
jgi:hypothetical protein